MLNKEKYRMPCAYEFWMVARARWALAQCAVLRQMAEGQQDQVASE